MKVRQRRKPLGMHTYAPIKLSRKYLNSKFVCNNMTIPGKEGDI